ncbi:hypothetical protein NP493_474g05079 [Ridgeia piscesae]|uniref:Annexin n=1 Tax=Ridgeia piscesae TaxID=27915 RepID=A0AAD9KY10_RIDPI|nr:hypothetical protein NP493_474g05079 [Ridgeia piscesae]
MGCIVGKQNGGARDLLDLNNDDPLRECDTAESYAEVIRTSIIAGNVCGHTANELTEIQKEYQNICGHTLVSDVQAKYDDEEVGHILIERLSLKESPDDDAEAASVYSAQLVDAARNGMLFGDGHIFQDCAMTKSPSTLKLILEMFLKQCQRDMTVEIEKYYPAGHTREALITMVKLLRNRWLYMSHIIHELMSSEKEEEEKHLLYLVLSMDQDSVSELKRVYKNTFFEMMARDVKETVKDAVIQHALLNHIK